MVRQTSDQESVSFYELKSNCKEKRRWAIKYKRITWDGIDSLSWYKGVRHKLRRIWDAFAKIEW